MKPNIFTLQSTCMEVSVSLSCLFVHGLPYQTTVVHAIPLLAVIFGAQITVPFSTLEWGLFRLVPTILTGVKSKQAVATTLVTIKEHNIKLMVHVFLTAISHGHTYD